jgi:hypothetical protein
VQGPNPACGYSARLGGLPRAAGWATIWWPDQATEAAGVLRGCAHAVRSGSVVTAQPACGGALAINPVVASLWQGVAGKLVGTTGRAPGKEADGGAHRGGGRDDGAERQLCAAARDEVLIGGTVSDDSS